MIGRVIFYKKIISLGIGFNLCYRKHLVVLISDIVSIAFPTFLI